MTNAFNLSQLANNTNSSGQIALGAGVSGTLPVANGGTGAATLTSGSLVVGAGTSSVTGIAAGASGNLLTSTGAVWSSQAPPSNLGGAPNYVTGSVIGVNTWYQMPANCFVTARLSGVYINGIGMYAGPSTSVYTVIYAAGWDVNNYSSSQGGGWYIKAGTYIYFASPYIYGYSWETIEIYRWNVS